MVFSSWAGDLAFFGTLAVVWLLCFNAQEAPQDTYRHHSHVEDVAGRAVVATLLAPILGGLPALVAVALVGSSFA